MYFYLHFIDNFKRQHLSNLVDTVLYWKCSDQCKYDCMWETVGVFEERKMPIPQFHGKWPFIRVWGMQEPASVIIILILFKFLFIFSSYLTFLRYYFQFWISLFTFGDCTTLEKLFQKTHLFLACGKDLHW